MTGSRSRTAALVAMGALLTVLATGCKFKEDLKGQIEKDVPEGVVVSSFAVDTVDGGLDGPQPLQAHVPGTPPKVFELECTVVVDGTLDGKPFHYEGKKTVKIKNDNTAPTEADVAAGVGQIMIRGNCKDPLILQLPKDASAFKAFAKGASGSDTPLPVIGGLDALPIAPGPLVPRTLTAETDQQLVVIGFPDNLSAGSYDVRLEFSLASSRAIKVKPIIAALMQCGDSPEYLPPLFPDVTSLADVPEFSVPVSDEIVPLETHDLPSLTTSAEATLVCPPITTLTTAPRSPDGANGWFLHPVQVTLSPPDASDTRYTVEGGGTQSYAAPFTIAADGAHTLAYWSTGNDGTVEATRTTTVKVDQNDPTATASITPSLQNGWYASPTVTLTGNDGTGSGVAHIDYSRDGGPWTLYSGPLSGFATGNHFVQFRATDIAGRVGATGLLAFKADGAKPSVTITKPAEGAVYPLDKPLPAAYKCVDSESGIQSCTGTVANGAAVPTGTIGPHTFTVTATDRAGNTTTKSVSYSVAYTWNGYFSPTTNSETSTLNLVHAGDLIKLGFGLDGDRGLGVLAGGYPASVPVACPSWTSHSVPGAGAGAFPGLSFGASGHYSYGWQTSAAWAGTCRRFELKLNDGTPPHTAVFMFSA